MTRLIIISQNPESALVAERLNLSLPTIKWYRKKLIDKFEASNTAELILRAKERGMI